MAYTKHAVYNGAFLDAEVRINEVYPGSGQAGEQDGEWHPKRRSRDAY